MQRIESIDPQGDMMKKPGPNTEVLQLAFCFSGQPPEGIEFFNGRLKTPSTAFHSSGPPESTKIYEELHGLLSPDLNMVLPIVVDTPLAFPDFTILARALRVHDQGPGPRHTGGGQTRTFELSWDDHSLLVEVYSGQTPPAPQEFTVRDTTYRLLTYQTPDGERLFPDHFLIVASS